MACAGDGNLTFDRRPSSRSRSAASPGVGSLAVSWYQCAIAASLNQSGFFGRALPCGPESRNASIEASSPSRCTLYRVLSTCTINSQAQASWRAASLAVDHADYQCKHRDNPDGPNANTVYGHESHVVFTLSRFGEFLELKSDSHRGWFLIRFAISSRRSGDSC